MRREANAQGSGLRLVGWSCRGYSCPVQPAMIATRARRQTRDAVRRLSSVTASPGGLGPDDRLRRARPLRRRADAGLDRGARGVLPVPLGAGRPRRAFAVRRTGPPQRLRRLGATVDVVELPDRPDVPPLVVGEIGGGRGRSTRSSTTTSSRPSRSTCGRRRRTSRRSATVVSSPAARPTTRASSCPGSGRSRPTWRRSARSPAGSASWSRARRSTAASTSTRCSTSDPGSARSTAPSSRAAGWIRQGRPEIIGGVRGMAVVELVCRTIAYDAHSSAATILPSAPVRLAQALAGHVRRGRLPGGAPDSTTGIIPPSAAQLAIVDAIPVEVVDEFRRSSAVERLLGGLDGIAAMRAMTFAPTLQHPGSVVGLHRTRRQDDHPGRGARPARHPDRPGPAARGDRGGDPDASRRARVRRHRGHRRAGRAAYWSAAEDPILDAAARASEAVFGAAVRALRVDARDRADVAGLRSRPGADRRASAAGPGTVTPTLPTRTSGSTTRPSGPDHRPLPRRVRRPPSLTGVRRSRS